METYMGFATEFKELTGVPKPFSWQQRLFDLFVANRLPRRLDIPTGLGKTSIIPIWLMARQKNPKLPRRLIYVVNRRTIVDQATEIAEKLQKRWMGPSVHVSTLRGQKADNGDWQRDPAAQAIIIGTVDMIGSKLLFNAYRGSRWHKSFEAGLIGKDSLIVHDEAHLTGPFDVLLDRVAFFQKGEPVAPNMQILSLSATTSPTSKKEEILRLTKEDVLDAAVKQRIHAAKRLKFENLPPNKKLSERLAELACAHKETPVRVLVFVRSPEDASKCASAIQSVLGKDTHRVETLTGTIRGKERDKLVEKPVFKHFVDRTIPADGAVYLVCTSAGEVGVDFDADHMVCDLSTLDSMIQRLGRVNRRGERKDSQVRVVVEFKAKAGPLDKERKVTKELLASLSEKDEGHDASPWSLRSLVSHPNYAKALTPEPSMVELQRMTLDAWSLTSIGEDWPIAADVAPYLHGLEDDQRQTEVAWRKEFDWLNRDDIDGDALERIFEQYPLKPREILKDRTDVVCDLLLAIKEADPGRRIIVVGKKAEFLALSGFNEQNLYQKILNRVVVIPASYGGIDLGSGMINPKRAGTSDSDVADLMNTEDPSENRFRVLLENTADGWQSSSAPSDIQLPLPTEMWKEWMTEAAKLNECRCVHQIELARPDGDDDQSGQVILFFKALVKQSSAKKEKLLLADHNEHVRTSVAGSCATLSLGKEIRSALELAGGSHDLGKGRNIWQSAIYNTDRNTAYAKSTGRGMKWQNLNGYRHEFGSLCDVLKLAGFKQFEKDETGRDLALHIMAAHHGRARPHFPQGGTDPEGVGEPHELLSPHEVALRFERLQRQFGYWGLAWLEALIVCADREASTNPPGRNP
jgi:CRISPR-associated endonuclease/helicase Cas3